MKLSKSAALILFAALAVPNMSFAKTDFPFTVVRDSKGKLVSISLPKSVSLAAAGNEEDELAELRSALDARWSSPMAFTAAEAEIDEHAPVDEKERETYEQAKAYLGQSLTKNAADDKRLDGEFDKAKSEVAKVPAWRLLAAPAKTDAFDTEKVLEQTIGRVVDVAQKVFPIDNPVFSVFEFLLDTHVENLKSRREFFQNQLLVAIEHDSKLFTAAEKSAIRSSIFYSRISMIKTETRSKARKAWSTYGDTQLKALLAKCNGFASAKSAFGPCFRLEGQEVRNKLVNKNKLSKSPSLAFDYSEPTRMRSKRQFLITAKLGLKLLPVPGLFKTPVRYWLNSQYIDQRSSEGFMYGWTDVSNETRVGEWVLYGTTNPLITK